MSADSDWDSTDLDQAGRPHGSHSGNPVQGHNGHKFCSCGSCAVDGGLDYLRRCGNLGDWEELSEVEKVEGNNALT